CIQEMSQSFSSNVPDNSPEQEAATGHPILRRLDSPTSQAIQLPELEITLTPATGRKRSQEINNLSVPALISQAPGPSRKIIRSPSSPFFLDAITFSDGKPTSETSELNPEDVTARLEDLEVEVDTLHAGTEDKELLISKLQDSLTAAENEIAILQIRVADTEGKRREHSQEINNLSAPALISPIPGPSRKRSRSPSSPFFPDAITFSDGRPTSETSELNPKDVTARLEDLEVEIDTLHADTEDKELLISELQDSLAAAESEIAILQIRVADTESRRVEDHEQIQKILTHLSL
ncbi:hypothetical protein Tco_0180110, partial [Tanacetum coccineum]